MHSKTQPEYATKRSKKRYLESTHVAGEREGVNHLKAMLILRSRFNCFSNRAKKKKISKAMKAVRISLVIDKIIYIGWTKVLIIQMNKIGIQYALNMGTLSTAWTGNIKANISCYSSLTLLFWKGSGSGQVINTKIPSHEVATSEQGLPQSMVSITPV
ncbi:hypothetical protein K501DRAFT_314787 [Backusella circina FSU 941]|nr:hypothetical protein K501DRAFT_314787 [Backusella circina FSU 941]